MNDSDLRAISILEMAKGMSREIPGLAKFADHLISKQPLRVRTLMFRYLNLKEEERIKFLKAAEADGWDKPPAKKDS